MRVSERVKSKLSTGKEMFEREKVFSITNTHGKGAPK